MTCTVVVILRVIYKKAWILYRACCLDSVFLYFNIIYLVMYVR